MRAHCAHLGDVARRRRVRTPMRFPVHWNAQSPRPALSASTRPAATRGSASPWLSELGAGRELASPRASGPPAVGWSMPVAWMAFGCRSTKKMTPSTAAKSTTAPTPSRIQGVKDLFATGSRSRAASTGATGSGAFCAIDSLGGGGGGGMAGATAGWRHGRGGRRHGRHFRLNRVVHDVFAADFSRRAQQLFDRDLETSDVIREGRSQRIQPVRRAEEVSQVVRQSDVLDAKPHDGQPGIRGQLHFAQHLFGIIRMARENQEHHLAFLNGARDLAGERAARAHVPGSDPASDPRLFERLANGVGYLSVLRRVRNENVMRHGKNRIRSVLPRLAEQATELIQRDAGRRPK